MSKVNEALITDIAIFNMLSTQAKLAFKNRSSYLAEGVNTCFVTPENLIKVLDYLMRNDTDQLEKGEKKNTAVSFQPAQAEQLSILANRLGMPRNILLNIIAKGLLLGII